MRLNRQALPRAGRAFVVPEHKIYNEINVLKRGTPRRETDRAGVDPTLEHAGDSLSSRILWYTKVRSARFRRIFFGWAPGRPFRYQAIAGGARTQILRN
jgi:hypothetical protein